MNSIYMSRGYVYEKRIFPIVLKEIQGGVFSAPPCILYTLCVLPYDCHAVKN